MSKEKKSIIPTLIGKIKFFSAQSIVNVRRNFLIGITFAVCFSLVSGLSFTGESAQNTVLHAALLENISLEDVMVNLKEESGNPYYNQANFDEQLISTIENQVIPYYDYYFRTTDFELDHHYFRQNDSSILNNSQYLNGLDEYESTTSFLIADDILYQMDKFEEVMLLLEGEYPTKINELAIDVLFADAYNLKVGDIYNMSYFVPQNFQFRNYAEVPTNYNWTISGIYCASTRVTILGQYISPEYTYDSNTNNITISSDLEGYIEGTRSASILFNMPFLSYYNYSNAHRPDLHQYNLMRDEHPAFNLDADNGLGPYAHYFQEIDYNYGLILNTDKLNVNSLESLVEEFDKDFNEIELRLNNKISINSDTINTLRGYTNSFQMIQLILFTLNIPVIIFAIILGGLAIKNETKNRLEEYLLLRSKGMKTLTIRIQLVFESLFLALFAGGIGFFGGIPIFFAIRSIIGQTLIAFNIPELIFSLSWTPLWMTVITGVVTSLIASIGSIILIKRLPAHKILELLGQSSLDAEYSEKSIFKDPGYAEIEKDEKLDSISKTKHLTRKQIKQLPKEQQERIKQKQKLDKIYAKTAETKKSHPFQRGKAKVAIVYIILGILPLVLILLSMWALSPNAPDFLFQIFGGDSGANESSNQIIFAILPFTLLITLFFLTAGIIRLIGMENPHILARLTSKVLNPFLGKMSRLVGIEAIRKRQYAKVSSIIAVFIAILIFSSSLLFSLLNVPVLGYQAAAGADVRVTMYNPDFESVSTDVESLENITLIEEQLKQITAFENENVTIVNDVTTIMTELSLEFGSGLGSYYQLTSFGNFSQLYNMFTEDGKYHPDSSIAVLNGLTPLSSGGIPNCIITSDTANYYDIEVGDTFEITHLVYYEEYYIYNEITGALDRNATEMKLEVEVAGIIDIFPGVWYNGYTPLYPYTQAGSGLPQIYALIDMSIINTIPMNYTLLSYSHYLDVDNSIQMNENNTFNLRTGIRNVTRKWYGYTQDPSFYIDSYDEMVIYEITPDVTRIINNGLVLEFGIIGLVLGVGIAVLLISFQQSNRFFNGVLLARGYGKSGLFKFVFSLLFVIYALAYIVGSIIGVITTFFSIRAFSLWENFVVYGQIPFPLIINWSLIWNILGFVPLVTIGLYLINYVFESRKSVSKYFHKF